MRDILCPTFCSFFKPNQEPEMGCGGVLWLERRPELKPKIADLVQHEEDLLYGLDRDDPRLQALCLPCPYRVRGCDFRDSGPEGRESPPCGGLRAAAGLLSAGLEMDPDKMETHPEAFVCLGEPVSLHLLEEPSVYDRASDELYEINQEALEGLKRCRGDLTLAQARLEHNFLQTCLAEGLLYLSDQPRPRPLPLCPAPNPSLRYLELQVTWRCNLACAHCYLGPARKVDLDQADVARVVREFEDMGGLRLLISGGEPLLHPAWNQINAILAGSGLRRVLLSNGTRLTPLVLDQLNCEEVQISLDGMERGHESLRGKGSFKPALDAARRVLASGRDLSIATMAHSANLAELEDLDGLVRELGAKEWSVDSPVLSADSPFALSLPDAARAMEHGFGAAYHGSPPGMACGLHLCTVAADGTTAQCAFFLDDPLGEAQEGLWTCWQRRKPIALADISGCSDCEAAGECAGGCRFRAPGPTLPDPVMCSVYGMTPVLEKKE